MTPKAECFTSGGRLFETNSASRSDRFPLRSVSSLFLCFAFRSVGLGLALGALLGIAQVFVFFDLEGGSAIDRAMTCAALGLPFWAAINVVLLPLLAG